MSEIQERAEKLLKDTLREIAESDGYPADPRMRAALAYALLSEVSVLAEVFEVIT